MQVQQRRPTTQTHPNWRGRRSPQKEPIGTNLQDQLASRYMNEYPYLVILENMLYAKILESRVKHIAERKISLTLN